MLHGDGEEDTTKRLAWPPISVPALQRAWRQHGRQWAGLYGVRRAVNPGSTSVSVPVPRGVLMQAIVEAMFVS